MMTSSRKAERIIRSITAAKNKNMPNKIRHILKCLCRIFYTVYIIKRNSAA